MMRERTWKDWNEEPAPLVLPCIAGPWDGEGFIMSPHERTAVPFNYEHGYYEVMGHGDGFALVWQRGAFSEDFGDKQIRGTDAN